MHDDNQRSKTVLKQLQRSHVSKNFEEKYAWIQIAIIFHVYFLIFNPLLCGIFKSDFYELRKNLLYVYYHIRVCFRVQIC